jgi:hypothetical protein
MIQKSKINWVELRNFLIQKAKTKTRCDYYGKGFSSPDDEFILLLGKEENDDSRYEFSIHIGSECFFTDEIRIIDGELFVKIKLD